MRPLSDIDIVEIVSDGCPLALRLAVAMTGRIAADLGARVTSCETDSGDPVRAIPPMAGSDGALFVFLNAGKKTRRCTAAEARALLAKADAVVTDRAFADAEDRAALPAITASLSFFAPNDAAPRLASEFTIAALSGLLDLVGQPDREPLKLAGHQMAYAAGLAGYAGIAAALCRKKGERSTVRVDLFNVAVWLNWKTAVLSTIGAPVLTRGGKQSLWQVVRCADGWLALVFEDQDWNALRDLLRDPRLDDPMFATREGRRENIAMLMSFIEENMMRHSRSSIRAEALKRRLPIGPIWTPQELRADPQYIERGFFTPLSVSGAALTRPRLPVLWNGRGFPVAPPDAIEPGKVGS